MIVFPTKNISVSAVCPLDTAYDFLHRPENFPKWAAGFCTSIRKEGKSWVAETPHGQMRVDFTEWNKFGILDHVVHGPNGPIYVPMRLVPNGHGVELVFTLFRTPDMSDEAFAKDAEAVEKDLNAVKGLLEQLAPSQTAGEGEVRCLN